MPIIINGLYLLTALCLNYAVQAAETCLEDTINIHRTFVQANFEQGRNTVGQDQVEPVKTTIMNFIKANQHLVVTEVSIISGCSKIPFYSKVNGKKIIDAESANKNLALAKEREQFLKKAVGEIKLSGSEFKSINFVTSAELRGPDFIPVDLNDRFVTAMTPGYTDRIVALYNKHQMLFEDQAVMSSVSVLLDEKKYSNLFQAKFKPFEGFLIEIQGYKKDSLKCRETLSPDNTKPENSSKQ